MLQQLSVLCCSNLFADSTLNVMNMYMKYKAEVVPLYMYILWGTSIEI